MRRRLKNFASRSGGDFSHIFDEVKAKNKEDKKTKTFVKGVKFRGRRMIHTKMKKRAGDRGFKEQYDEFKGTIEELERLREVVEPMYEVYERKVRQCVLC